MGFLKADHLRIGIDIGGTFTDFVIYSSINGNIETHKILSTPENPAHAILNGIDQLQIPSNSRIIHGSTVATNALLERKGAKTALIATQGFKDILLIGRQNRPSLYDWTEQKPKPLIDPELSFEIDERVDCEGKIIKSLHIEDIEPILKAMLDKEVQSVAISLLFSFLQPKHEREIARLIRTENISVSVSSEIAPEYREFERTSTTAINAYVSPKLNQYLSVLESNLYDSNLQIMQSNGGMISIEKARQNGVRCILSGPAGGVIGAQYLSQLASQVDDQVDVKKSSTQIITFDMGGTSTDISLINNNPLITNESTVGGYPINIPMLDIHTIGAGGGSIAYTDKGGALLVGPQSAGADPGPACYGRGELPTVTDANLVLGRLVPEFFLGGSMKLDADRSWASIHRLGTQLGLNPIQCAMGIITVANAHMERALRVISVERGFDPRDFTLFAFGGAGGLHAIELARNMRIPRVLISPYASVLSAFGMLTADIVLDYVQTVMLDDSSSLKSITGRFHPLIKRGRKELLSQGVDLEDTSIQLSVDARYLGQSYELTVPYSHKWISDFHQAHQMMYGFHAPDTKVELVNIRVKAIGHTLRPVPGQYPRGNKNPENALIGFREVFSTTYSKPIPCYQHELLEPANIIQGPAMIIRPDTTVLIDTTDSISVDSFKNMWIQVGTTV